MTDIPSLEVALSRASEGLRAKMLHSVELIRKAQRLADMYDPVDGFFLAFSGGKDSQALYHITQLGGGRIWLNPPYSHPIIDYFMEKMALHNNGIALLFNRMDTDMWQDLILPHASALLVIRGRVRFLRPDGTEPKANPGCGSVLVAYGEQNAETLKHCNIKGTFIKL